MQSRDLELCKFNRLRSPFLHWQSVKLELTCWHQEILCLISYPHCMTKNPSQKVRKAWKQSGFYGSRRIMCTQLAVYNTIQDPIMTSNPAMSCACTLKKGQRGYRINEHGHLQAQDLPQAPSTPPSGAEELLSLPMPKPDLLPPQQPDKPSHNKENTTSVSDSAFFEQVMDVD